jgi:hypothetical protein
MTNLCDGKSHTRIITASNFHQSQVLKFTANLDHAKILEIDQRRGFQSEQCAYAAKGLCIEFQRLGRKGQIGSPENGVHPDIIRLHRKHRIDKSF